MDQLAESRHTATLHRLTLAAKLTNAHLAAECLVRDSDEALGRMKEEKAARYSCAFCGETAADDPRPVRIELSWDHSEASQQLGAHFAAFRRHCARIPALRRSRIMNKRPWPAARPAVDEA